MTSIREGVRQKAGKKKSKTNKKRPSINQKRTVTVLKIRRRLGDSEWGEEKGLG